jgi:hypothetical protein
VSWDPINLALLEPRPVTLPTIGGVGLVYPGRRHVFSGPPESAKTLAAYAIALEEVRRGENALLIDFEMGPWDARDRLREMGAADPDLEKILYVEPELPANDAIIEELATRWTFTLAIIDAAAGAYALQDLDDNHRRDVESFARLFVDIFWRRGIATIVLDHVTKNADSRGRFAIGSERKVGGTDVHLGFEAVLPLIRGGRGLFKITTHKDRLGHLSRPEAADLELRSDPSTGLLTRAFRAPETPSEDSRWQPTRLMEKVSEYLELPRPELRDGVSRTEVEKSVVGRAAFVRRALDELIADGYVVETGGTRGSRLVRSLRPFPESDPVPARPDPVPAAIDAPSATPSPVPPPHRGTGSVRASRGAASATPATTSNAARRRTAAPTSSGSPPSGATTS